MGPIITTGAVGAVNGSIVVLVISAYDFLTRNRRKDVTLHSSCRELPGPPRFVTETDDPATEEALLRAMHVDPRDRTLNSSFKPSRRLQVVWL